MQDFLRSRDICQSQYTASRPKKRPSSYSTLFAHNLSFPTVADGASTVLSLHQHPLAYKLTNVQDEERTFIFLSTYHTCVNQHGWCYFNWYRVGILLFEPSLQNIALFPVSKRGTRWHSWLRHCATSRKAAG